MIETDSDFVSAIVNNAQAKAVVVNGNGYSSAPLFNPPLPDQQAFPAVPLFTLDSLIDYIAANRDGSILAEAQILCRAQLVELVGKPIGEKRLRDTYVKVVANVATSVFGGYQTIEDFRIYLLTQFSDTPDRETVLRFIAKVSDEHVATSEDNGISQSVTVKSGIATHTQGVVPSPLQLAPIRTFIEVAQPVGHFLFRLKQVKDALPQAALFELHTNWQREAAVSIKAYLDAKSEKLGDARIPVFA